MAFGANRQLGGPLGHAEMGGEQGTEQCPAQPELLTAELVEAFDHRLVSVDVRVPTRGPR